MKGGERKYKHERENTLQKWSIRELTMGEMSERLDYFYFKFLYLMLRFRGIFVSFLISKFLIICNCTTMQQFIGKECLPRAGCGSLCIFLHTVLAFQQKLTHPLSTDNSHEDLLHRRMACLFSLSLFSSLVSFGDAISSTGSGPDI